MKTKKINKINKTHTHNQIDKIKKPFSISLEDYRGYLSLSVFFILGSLITVFGGFSKSMIIISIVLLIYTLLWRGSGLK